MLQGLGSRTSQGLCSHAAGFGQPDARTGHVVVQLRTSSAVDLLRYACSPRIIPISTGQINSSRCAGTDHRLIRHALICCSPGLSSLRTSCTQYLRAHVLLECDILLFFDLLR